MTAQTESLRRVEETVATLAERYTKQFIYDYLSGDPTWHEEVKGAHQRNFYKLQLVLSVCKNKSGVFTRILAGGKPTAAEV